MLGKDSCDGAKTTRSQDVANDTDDDHGRSLNDGHGLNDFFLVHLRTRTIKITDNVCHTSLVSHEGG